MPRLTAEQLRELRALAGMPSAEASVEVLLAAVGARLSERNRQLASPARRDQVIEGAIQAGKFTEARRGHYRQAWDQDPQGTEATIASLTPVGSLADAAVADAGDDLDELETALYGPTREQRWAAQDAEADRIDAELRRAETEAAAAGLSDAAFRELFGEDG